jgi:hypothetical protein
MTGQVRYIHNSRNLLSAAVLAATNTRASSAIRRTAVDRSGNGVIGLSGPYTGTVESDIDIEIASGAGAERITEQSFTGVGTGALANMEAQAGATPQQYTVTLIDVGTASAAAETDIEGVTLAAKATGSGGNDINLTVDQSGLVFTATDYSLLDDLPEGATEISGSGWDWATAAGVGDDVPSGAKRVVIGDDRSVIYRQWKTYRDGAWVYRFLPAIAREYKAGERVYEVGGSRSCTLTDGVTPEVYSSVVTLYDLLAGIRDGSDLVELDGVLSAAETVDNPAAVVDLITRTDAHVAWTSGTGSSHARGFINHSASSGANTEIITARCHANQGAEGAGLGRERWTLRGSVSGELGNLATGEAYAHPAGLFALTVPTRLPDGYDDVARGDISADIAYASRAADVTPPQICADRLRLGPNAVNRSIRFVYTVRRTDCFCDDTQWTRLARADQCLEVDPTEEITVSDMVAGYAARMSDVQKWHADFVEANTELTATNDLRSAIHDIALADAVRSILLTCLQRVYSEGVTAWAAWATDAAITRDEVREPTTANGYKYRADIDGTTHGSTEPTWPTTVGLTVADNGITWECESKKPEEEFDDLLSAIDTDLTALEAIETDFTDFESLPIWAAATAYTRGDLVRPAYDAGEPTIGGHVIVCIGGGTSAAASEFFDPGSWANFAAYDFGKITGDGTAQWMGLGNVPFWSDSDINSSGTTLSMSAHVEDFARRYGAQADFVLTTAEVTPDFNSASTTGTLPGGACWRDPGDAYWWVPESTALLPAFTNYEYVSVMAPADGSDAPVPTHEFGMVIKVECPEGLAAGDSVTIHIGDAGWPSTYLVGDELHMATIGAAPLYLGGGVTGTDTFAWQVARSVDGLGTDYSQDLTAPALYDDGDVKFRVSVGGIAHELGDAFVFCIEDSTFKWRQDSGAWSGNLDIDQTALADGLKAEFTEGSCPSFESGDTSSFTALQPYAIGKADNPDDQAFAWTGALSVITASVTGSVDAILIARHTIPSGAVVTVDDGETLSEVMTWSAGPMVLLLDAALTDPSLTITIEYAADASIGWIWAGAILGTDVDPVQTRARRYRMARGAGLNPSADLQGRGIGFDVRYAGLSGADFGGLVALLEDVKADADAPLCLVVGEADSAELVSAPDDIDYDDFLLWSEGASNRALALNVEFGPWLTAP